ncbi:hypothetical protein RJ639_001423 [Escallonia herrerae]|uniref:protein-S-isoprenylcysteine alpha-carbonyl methylesterase n=1 Tax=Escallonia herrerae TaxID=1293975 RepID=A0AA88X857_9ASTE|nr:hypothetical protein RJ639_024855 [Escallonia herrerae]KAK3041321.1 hypothetical protein RJ639_001423 [Escallonia herrerae]
MQAQILPVSNPSSLMPPSLPSTGTLLIRSDGDDDENKIEIKPFLSRSSSYNGVTTASTKTRPKFYQLWRRRVASDASLSDRPAGDGRHHSFRQGVGQAASDTYLITRLCFKLLRYLGSLYTHKFPKPVNCVEKFSKAAQCTRGLYASLLPKSPTATGARFGSRLAGGISYSDTTDQVPLGRVVDDRVLSLEEHLAQLYSSQVRLLHWQQELADEEWKVTDGSPDSLPLAVTLSYLCQDFFKLAITTSSQVRLDLYLPKDCNGPKPVVAFVTGGAWIIGYKAWGSLLGQQLSERDIIVACIDYRNFPQGTISDMVKDASQGISFVCNNIAEYGGDPNRIYLMGQSAGAHIAACALVEQAISESGEGESTSWSVSQIKAYFGLSGGYNLLNLVDHFHRRGLYKSIFVSIMEGEQSLRRFSPEVVVQDSNIKNAVSLLPPIVLFHGTADYSIPSDASKTFAEALQRVGVHAESILYEGKTHTDLFLQDPMRGGSDDMFEDLVALIHAEDSEALAKHAAAPPRKRLVPEFMLKLAHTVSPF